MRIKEEKQKKYIKINNYYKTKQNQILQKEKKKKENTNLNIE